ncbi:MAG TPA: universal stress protein [Streptosporangiaceae bacterium]|nr:universal stress protein [Streptosporangiaceae bacterium]
MSGPRRIIIGANGSPGSIRALRYAEDLAYFSHAMLVPVIAWTPPGGELAERRAPSSELRRAWAEAARHRLRAALAAAWGSGLPDGLNVRAIIARGEPGPVLVDEADSDGDLLVLGTGRRGLRSCLVSGRVTRYCLRHAECPVLAVPPAALSGTSGLRGWAFRHRELTLDRAMRDWGKTAA